MDAPVSVTPPRHTKKWIAAGLVAALAITGCIIWGISSQKNTVEPPRNASACIFDGALPTAKDVLVLQGKKDDSSNGAVELLAGYLKFSTQLPVLDAAEYTAVADALASPEIGQEMIINAEASRNFQYSASVELDGASYLVEEFLVGESARISISLPYIASNGETAVIAGTYSLVFDDAGWVIRGAEYARAANVITDTGQLLAGPC